VWFLSNLLRRFIRQGTLRIRDAGGKVHVFGNRLPGPDVSIRLHNRNLYMKLFINPELYAAEAYMDGALTLENDTQIYDFLLLFSVNRTALYSYGSQKLMRRVWRGLRRWHQANPIGLAAAHARHHYDISTELYRLFLDDQMQYSCAYFRNPERDTLEERATQQADSRHHEIAIKARHDGSGDWLRLGWLCHSSGA
jgi:cyclopropane-fatty-acyl-phospholipid synthase